MAFPEQRIQKIKSFLLESQQVDIKTLKKSLPFSISTIRRDLVRLEEEGFIQKYHGGVMINAGSENEKEKTDLIIPNLKEKQKIGVLAANIVNNGDIIFVSAGLTCLELAKNLKTKTGLTVITNSFLVSNELCVVPGMKVIIIGGDVVLEDNMPFTLGNIASMITDDLYIQKSFMSCNGVSVEHGYSVNNHIFINIYRTLLDLSDNMIILADGDKFGKRAFKKFCDFDQIKCLVTDRRPDKLYCDYCQEHAISLVF